MPATLPPRILSGRVFLGQAPQPAHANLDALARYATPEAVARAIDAARESGCGGLMTLGDERVVAGLRLARRRGSNTAFHLLPIVPNVIGYVREATEYGMVGAGLRRVARVGPIGLAGAAVTGALRPHRVLRRDFPTLLDILYEVEMGELGRFHPPVVFLHQMMTDMALSYEAPAVLERFVRRMRRRFGAEPGLVTANLARLAHRLHRWGIDVSLVAAPVNREGLLMPRGLEECAASLEASGALIVADRLAPEMPTPPDAIAWALEQPRVAAAVLEIDPLAGDSPLRSPASKEMSPA